MKLAAVLATALFTVATVAMPGIGPAAAHTKLRSSQPSAGQPVGGEVEMIILDFIAPVVEFSGTVEDPDGNILSGRVGRPNDFVVVYELDEPLGVEGQHVLSYSTVAEDGIVQESALAFTYDESAPEYAPAIPDGLPGEDEGPDWILIAGIGLIVVGIALAGVHWFRRSSAAEPN